MRPVRSCAEEELHLSHALYRLGRFAARRPLIVIATWLLLAVIVVGSSLSFGRKLEDSFEAPGLDSTAALDLLTAAQSDAAGRSEERRVGKECA